MRAGGLVYARGCAPSLCCLWREIERGITRTLTAIQHICSVVAAAAVAVLALIKVSTECSWTLAWTFELVYSCCCLLFRWIPYISSLEPTSYDGKLSKSFNKIDLWCLRARSSKRSSWTIYHNLPPDELAQMSSSFDVVYFHFSPPPASLNHFT